MSPVLQHIWFKWIGHKQTWWSSQFESDRVGAGKHLRRAGQRSSRSLTGGTLVQYLTPRDHLPWIFPPWGQEWCRGTKTATLVSMIVFFPLSEPLISLPPLGIFLVQWPPFTTVTQISWAGVIPLHRSVPLGEGEKKKKMWQNFLSASVTPLSDSVLHLPCSLLTTLYCQTKKLIPPVTVF